MAEAFDKGFWEEHWEQRGGQGAPPPNPYLLAQTQQLTPGTALDAGCGQGSEAVALAAAGWDVTAVDIAAGALQRAAEVAASFGVSERIAFLEADLGSWQPQQRFDLVTTHYAHPSIPQLAFYERIASWVAPGGTLLIVGHLHDGHHPEAASVTAADISARFADGNWRVETAEERSRTVPHGVLHDVVFRATRL